MQMGAQRKEARACRVACARYGSMRNLSSSSFCFAENEVRSWKSLAGIGWKD